MMKTAQRMLRRLACAALCAFLLITTLGGAFASEPEPVVEECAAVEAAPQAEPAEEAPKAEPVAEAPQPQSVEEAPKAQAAAEAPQAPAEPSAGDTPAQSPAEAETDGEAAKDDTPQAESPKSEEAAQGPSVEGETLPEAEPQAPEVAAPEAALVAPEAPAEEAVSESSTLRSALEAGRVVYVHTAQNSVSLYQTAALSYKTGTVRTNGSLLMANAYVAYHDGTDAVGVNFVTEDGDIISGFVSAERLESDFIPGEKVAEENPGRDYTLGQYPLFEAAFQPKAAPKEDAPAAEEKPAEEAPEAAADEKPAEEAPEAAANEKPAEEAPEAAADEKPAEITPEVVQDPALALVDEPLPEDEIIIPETEVPLGVTITAHTANEGGVICYGDPMWFTSEVIGALPESLRYQWKYSADGGATWTAIEGANASVYETTLTPENEGYLWRVSVELREPQPQALNEGETEEALPAPVLPEAAVESVVEEDSQETPEEAAQPSEVAAA